MIPKIIHQTWKTKQLPDIFNYMYEHNVTCNNDFVFYLWTDDNSGENIDTFLKEKYPEIYKVFSNINLGVQKSDLARLAIMHYYGGIYIDLDILLLKSLNNLLDYNSDILYFAFEPSEQTKKLYNKENYICNAFFACSPGDKLVEKMLYSAIDIYNKFGDIIYNKFNIFGSDIFKFVINTHTDRNDYNIIERNKIYPINDIKLDDLNCINNDIIKLKSGNYNDSYMVHYWIHSNFEAKNILHNFKYNKELNIHNNLFNFFKEMYPNNKGILLECNYIDKYN